MYRLINQNIDLILTTLDYHLAIETHLSILRRFNQGDVRHDTSFHLDYRRYWGLNAARLSETFCLAYFDLMEGLRTNHNIDTETVVRHLYQLPTHKKGRQSLQFSFASKLVHTLDPHKPIYDSLVADFYFFRPPDPNKELDFRLRSLSTFYRFLCHEYERVLEQALLEPSILRFRQIQGVDENYTDEKIIDTLIWQFVTLLRKGALTDGHIVYS
jgi:hypothetical protein